MIPKYNKIIAILFLITTITACDVDRVPEDKLTDISFWNTENDIKLAANYLYTSLPTLQQTDDNWSDNTFATAPNTISDGSRIVPATDDLNYANNYKTIRAANVLVEKSSQALANGVIKEHVDWYVGEAKYFRARAYFQLLERFGGVPLILKSLTQDSPELQNPKATRDEILNVIYADLDEAILKLRTTAQLGAANYGRISKTAALALKAQVGLFEGTRAKFHGYGDPVKHLTIARDAAKLVMQSGSHSLFSSYFNLTQYAGEGFANKENILVRQYGNSLADNVISHNSARNLANGVCGGTKALADSYLMIDGLPITKSPLYVTPTKAIDEFKNRDPRMGDRFFKTTDPAQNATTGTFKFPGLTAAPTGYINRTYTNPTDYLSLKCYIDYPITRYAEILLIYAEATFELNGSISDADLNLSINLLRARASASMAKLTNAFVVTNGLDMRTEIRRERRVELALEGFRYFDLIRWKSAEIELPKEVLGTYFFTEYGTIGAVKLNPKNFILLQSSANRKFDPARDYLWPFPTKELALNPNLVQNPNW